MRYVVVLLFVLVLVVTGWALEPMSWPQRPSLPANACPTPGDFKNLDVLPVGCR